MLQIDVKPIDGTYNIHFKNEEKGEFQYAGILLSLFQFCVCISLSSKCLHVYTFYLFMCYMHITRSALKHRVDSMVFSTRFKRLIIDEL